MSNTPIDDKAREESSRRQRWLHWLIYLPIPFLVLRFRWLKGLFISSKSTTERRVDEKDRQAGIRRELRGLPAVHDQKKTP